MYIKLLYLHKFDNLPQIVVDKGLGLMIVLW